MKDEALPQRKHPAHHPPVERMHQPVVLLVTVCADKKQPVFANALFQRRLTDAWLQSSAWNVGRYVIMPDHIHLFCTPAQFPSLPLKNWVKYWKGLVKRTSGNSLFQQDCWDTQMRDYSHYVEKMSYVRENPARKGLVTDAAEWPFQGELTVIRW